MTEVKIPSWDYSVAETLTLLDHTYPRSVGVDLLLFLLARRSRTCQLPVQLQLLDLQDSPRLNVTILWTGISSGALPRPSRIVAFLPGGARYKCPPWSS